MSLYQLPEVSTKGITEKDLVICAPLADRLPVCSLVWWLARAIDDRGSGIAEFTLNEAAEALNKDEKTIRRYLKDGLSIGLFRFVNVSRKRVTVVMISLINVAKRLGLEKLGTFARVSVGDLRYLKYLATEIETDSLQRQSRRMKGKELDSKRTGKRLDSVSHIFKNSSLVCKGEPVKKGGKRKRKAKKKRTTEDKILHIGKRAAFVADDFTIYGASQARIAKNLGRSERTVRKRLSNKHRADRKVPHIQKKQLCVLVKNAPESDWRYLTREFYAEGNIETAKETAKLFNYKGSVFQAKNNIYKLNYELVSKKATKYYYLKSLSPNVDGRVQTIKDKTEPLN